VAAAFCVVFFLLWPLTAYPRAMLGAYLDHACGHYEVKTYGYPAPWRWEYGLLLKQKYGVELNAIAGCCVTEELERYVSGYNAASRSLLRARYGKDIFAECADVAERRWRAANPGR
jgi:hypothetical protein